jgi:hypothetical protein
MLPDVAGQPALIQLHMTLDQLRGLPGAAEAERNWRAERLRGDDTATPWSAGTSPAGTSSAGSASQNDSASPAGSASPSGSASLGAGASPGDSAAPDDGMPGPGDDAAGRYRAAGGGYGDWLAGRAAGDGEPGWAGSRAAAEAYGCDAVIAPVVTGYLDPAVLDAMTRGYLDPGHYAAMLGGARRDKNGWRRGAPLSPRSARRVQDTLLRYAADVLSGPAGLAAFLRTGNLAADLPAARWPEDNNPPSGTLGSSTPDGGTRSPHAGTAASRPGTPAGFLASVSLPLDTGTPTPTVPPHLRRAVARRDRHCAFPGCRQRPAACQVHHLMPRSKGGPTALWNLALLCSFHHLIAVHRRGWTLTLNADGTTTATSPDGIRTLHSHGPPGAAAA